MNLYTYVENSPLKYHDPTGHFAFLIPLALPSTWAAIGAGLAAIGVGLAAAKAINDENSKESDKVKSVPYTEVNQNENDEKITLYHATGLESVSDIWANGIDLSKGRPNLDFGQGFYVTRNEKEAEKDVRNKYNGVGAVMAFTVSKKAYESFIGKTFNGTDDEWKQFVSDNRAGDNVSIGYDYVEGPRLANPNDIGTENRLRGYGNQIAILSPQMAYFVWANYSHTRVYGVDIIGN